MKLDITTMTPEQLENVIEQIKGMQNDFKELDCKLEERAMKEANDEMGLRVARKMFPGLI